MRRCHYLPPGSLHALGHLSLFHAATSLSNWYEMACMGDISYRLIWMKFLSMLSMCVQSGRHRHCHWGIIAVLSQNSTVLMFVDIPSKHSGIDRYPFRYCSTVVSSTGSVSLYTVQGTDTIPFDTRLAHHSGTRSSTLCQYRTCSGFRYYRYRHVQRYRFCTGSVSLLYRVSIAFVPGQYRFCTGSVPL